MERDDVSSTSSDDELDGLGERVYRQLKAHLLSEAVISGERLDLGRLADQHRASLTPVRAALHRLAGEGLADAYPHEGFRVPLITEARLRDLYDWNRRLLLQSLPSASRRNAESGYSPAAAATMPNASHLEGVAADEPSAIAAVFCVVVQVSGNSCGIEAIAGMNDRLNRVRLKELRLIPDLTVERAKIGEALRAGHWVALRHELQAYHQRRIRKAPRLVEALNRRVT